MRGVALLKFIDQNRGKSSAEIIEPVSITLQQINRFNDNRARVDSNETFPNRGALEFVCPKVGRPEVGSPLPILFIEFSSPAAQISCGES